MKERIQKVLARFGHGSRREIEKMIAEGRIKVNQRLAQLGDRITEQDLVYIDGQLSSFSAPEQVRVLLYHKPEREICTRKDPEGRMTVFETLPRLKDGRWVIIGRLDINTSGLLLFTNEGELANRLMHPSAQVEREYAVRVLGAVDAEMTKKLAHGIELEDGKARFEDIVDVGGDRKNRWFHVVVVEGQHRLVRRLWESQGVKVSRLIRVRFGPIILPKSLRRGAWKELEPPEIKALQNISILPR
ncbi:23S rRNA pseudouridine(2605) synthase RluB [Coxiella endosymbiont of Ornithodoros maritimus]|uniref:23S rRNA pseudouridine(2605) synthase RluB n=1 Tax=Coxiella endosymbiont of Ornithodoros maritimus TaxID=1656172 RepID=UPI002263D5DF|nr:pseudouridine synthase [Coxiella endosymbiont of Ornithodoros maritimus]